MSPSEAIVSREPGGPPPVSVSISPRGWYYPRTRYIPARRWQLWSWSSHPALLRFQIVHTSCGLCPQTSGLLNHRGWSSQTVPFWSSPMQRLHPKPFLLLSHRQPRNGGPRQVSDLFPRWVPLLSTIPRQVQRHLFVVS